jgi:LysM repeat protein
MKRLVPAVAAGVCLSLCGCRSTGERQREQMQNRSDIERIEADLARLKARVDGASASQQDVYGRVEASRRAQEDRLKQIENRLTNLEQGVRAVDSAREADRKEIIENLSGKISGIVGSQPRRGGGRQTGVEHVVQQGETLSAIAAAYGVRVAVLMKENGLTDGNTIRAGQKLFIPD